jgi:predicted transcriptional regulator
MRESKITKQRKSKCVHPLTVEIDDHLYQNLIRYCDKFGRSKRWIIEDSLNCWVIQRDMESKKRVEEVS